MSKEAAQKWDQAKGEAAAAAQHTKEAAQLYGGVKYDEAKDKAGDLKDAAGVKAGEWKDAAGEKAGELKDAAAAKGATLYEQAKDAVVDAAGAAKDKVSDVLSSAKDKVSDALTAAPGTGVDITKDLESRPMTSPDGADFETETPPTLVGKHL